MTADVPNLPARLQAACYLEGKFQLRSGALSDHYFDKYRFESDPELLQAVAEAMRPLVPADAQLVAGPELGGVPLATIMSQLTGLPARFVRKSPKEYGTRQLAEGGDVAGQRLVIVEDVVSTGGQIVESVHALRNRGALCDTALCVILRNAEAIENLSREGIELRHLFSETDLVTPRPA